MNRTRAGIVCLLLTGFSLLPLQAEEKTREVKAHDLTLNVPTDWKQQQVSNNLRLAQFAIDPAEGDEQPAELVVFPPFGGTISENVKRWIDQFQAEGRKVVMTQGETEQGNYVLVDLSGTYNTPDGPPILRRTVATPDYRMIAVMLSAKAGGNYFLKLTGPKKTVESIVDEFRQTFGADASKEKPYEL